MALGRAVLFDNEETISADLTELFVASTIPLFAEHKLFSWTISRIFIYKWSRMKPSSGAGQLQVFKAEFFKALAHPLRIRVLEILVQGERSVHELQEVLGVDQPAVSQQLSVLRAKNIVDTRKEGTVVRYAVRDTTVRELLDVARRIFDHHLIGTQTMLRELRRESRRR